MKARQRHQEWNVRAGPAGQSGATGKKGAGQAFILGTGGTHFGTADEKGRDRTTKIRTTASTREGEGVAQQRNNEKK